jgi:ubiquinone/menaquinone biosynthesis C-methylase UbiE
LFAFLAECCQEKEYAWDCATGNGQAARSLASRFTAVIATDASEEQIAAASPHPGIEFRVAPAESPAIASGSVDLITVAQALHWFDIEQFFAQVLQVLKPGGVLAVWSYERARISPQCDQIIERIFAEVEPYWPPEREIVEDRYRSIVLPLAEFPVEDFEMQIAWGADEMLNYMRTWSATRRYLADKGADPVALHAAQLGRCWGEARRQVSWPLTLRAGRLLG